MGKVALVTGGTRGIGKSISLSLAAAGYITIANYLSNEEAANDICKNNEIITSKFDVSNSTQCEDKINDILTNYGKIDVLVNNAGVTNDKMLHKMSHEQWHNVMDVNINSCFNVTRPIINSMRQNKYGRIINISSINGRHGQLGQTNYSSAKAAMIGFTKALAKESAIKGITVNTICPGYCETDMLSKMPQQILEKLLKEIPVGRFGSPVDIARTVLFLADEKSSFITGATFDINGGHYM